MNDLERHWESPIAKAARNPKSLRLAVNGKCWDCIGAGFDPNPRGAIRDCAIRDCSLWNVRPYQTGETGELEPDLAGARACEA